MIDPSVKATINLWIILLSINENVGGEVYETETTGEEEGSESDVQTSPEEKMRRTEPSRHPAARPRHVEANEIEVIDDLAEGNGEAKMNSLTFILW